MVTLNAKLMGIDDEKLVARVVEIWGFFWDQVLTYVEGVCSMSASLIYPLTAPFYSRFFCHCKRTPSCLPSIERPNPTGQHLLAGKARRAQGDQI